MFICPVCKTKCETDYYYDSDIHMIIEEYKKCGVCEYYSEYAYGFCQEYIGNHEFGRDHNSCLYINQKKVSRNKYNKIYKSDIKKDRKRLYRNRILKSRVD